MSTVIELERKYLMSEIPMGIVNFGIQPPKIIEQFYVKNEQERYRHVEFQGEHTFFKQSKRSLPIGCIENSNVISKVRYWYNRVFHKQGNLIRKVRYELPSDMYDEIIIDSQFVNNIIIDKFKLTENRKFFVMEIEFANTEGYLNGQHLTAEFDDLMIDVTGDTRFYNRSISKPNSFIELYPLLDSLYRKIDVKRITHMKEKKREK